MRSVRDIPHVVTIDSRLEKKDNHGVNGFKDGGAVRFCLILLGPSRLSGRPTDNHRHTSVSMTKVPVGPAAGAAVTQHAAFPPPCASPASEMNPHARTGEE